jgi:uncharacterized membrane protein YphA (DoxX/SURF4 family)
MIIRSAAIWVLRLVPAIIFLQMLYLNFTAQPESVQLFTRIGIEPYGRIGTGIFELIACLLILIPRYTGYGAILGLMMMTVALYIHLTRIGIYFNGDPFLFIYAIVTFVCCALLIFINKTSLENQLKRK